MGNKTSLADYPSSTTYTWEIPSLSNDNKCFICKEYVQNNYPAYIPPEIIYLLSQFYSNDEYSLSDIKNAEYKQFFHSPIVSMFSFKWYLVLYPSGCTNVEAGQVILFICLISNPPNISKIITNITLQLCETSTIFTKKHYTFNYSDCNYCGWPANTLKLADIQHLNKMTFKMKLNIINVYNKTEDKIIKNYFKNYYIRFPFSNNQTKSELDLPKFQHQWIVSNINQLKTAGNGKSFYSEPFQIYSLKWYIALYPCGTDNDTIDCVDIYLCLISVPPNLTQISIKYKFIFKEANASRVITHDFKADSMEWGWNDIIKHDEIKKLNNLTIDLEMTILDVYDQHGLIRNDINNYNYNNNKNKNELTLSSAVEYEWKISDKETIRKVKDAKDVVACFASPIFEAFQSKWYIGFCPNGSRESRKGKINVFLHLASVISSRISFVVKFDLSFIESDTRHTLFCVFKHNNNSWGYTKWPLKTDDVSDLNGFTFRVSMILIDVYEKDDIITSKYIENCNKYKYNKYKNQIQIINIPSSIFQWKIPANILKKMKYSTKAKRYMYKSSKFAMHSIKWHLKCGQIDVDNYVNFCIHIVSLPTTTSVISIRYSVIFKEVHTRLISMATFTVNERIHSWGPERMSYDKIQNLNQCTIIFIMELVDIYDNMKNITSRFSTVD